MKLQAITAAALLLSIAAPLTVYAAPNDQSNSPGSAGILPAPVKQVPDWINQQAESLRDKMQTKQAEHSDPNGGLRFPFNWNPSNYSGQPQDPEQQAQPPSNPVDVVRLAQQFEQARQSIQSFVNDANDNWNKLATGFRDGANYLLDQLDSMANWTQRQVANARNYL